jgi:hypothetical protein
MRPTQRFVNGRLHYPRIIAARRSKKKHCLRGAVWFEGKWVDLSTADKVLAYTQAVYARVVVRLFEQDRPVLWASFGRGLRKESSGVANGRVDLN